MGKEILVTGDHLDELVEKWLDAKQAEETSKKEKLTMEAHIVRLLGNKPEGSQSFSTERFKVTTTGKVSRTIDPEKVEALKESGTLPPPLFNRLFRYKPSLSLADWRYAEMNEPEWFKKIAESGAVVSKPAKTALAIKSINE